MDNLNFEILIEIARRIDYDSFPFFRVVNRKFRVLARNHEQNKDPKYLSEYRLCSSVSRFKFAEELQRCVGSKDLGPFRNERYFCSAVLWSQDLEVLKYVFGKYPEYPIIDENCCYIFGVIDHKVYILKYLYQNPSHYNHEYLIGEYEREHDVVPWLKTIYDIFEKWSEEDILELWEVNSKDPILLSDMIFHAGPMFEDHAIVTNEMKEIYLNLESTICRVLENDKCPSTKVLELIFSRVSYTTMSELCVRNRCAWEMSYSLGKTNVDKYNYVKEYFLRKLRELKDKNKEKILAFNGLSKDDLSSDFPVSKKLILESAIMKANLDLLDHILRLAVVERDELLKLIRYTLIFGIDKVESLKYLINNSGFKIVSDTNKAICAYEIYLYDLLERSLKTTWCFEYLLKMYDGKDDKTNKMLWNWRKENLGLCNSNKIESFFEKKGIFLIDE